MTASRGEPDRQAAIAGEVILILARLPKRQIDSVGPLDVSVSEVQSEAGPPMRVPDAQPGAVDAEVEGRAAASRLAGQYRWDGNEKKGGDRFHEALFTIAAAPRF